jgi:glycosyltransferase 2 family protein
MKRLLLPALIAGLVLLTLLMAHVGIGGILHGLERLGVAGFALIVAIHLALNEGLALAWWLLDRAGQRLRYLAFCWGRLIRDAASEALPLAQVGGQVLGARALMMAGADGIFAGVSTIVDVTIEAMMQIAYAAIGLGLLASSHRGQGLILPLAGGAALMGTIVIVALAVLGTAPAWAEARLLRVVQRLPFLGGRADRAGELLVELRVIFSAPGRLALAAIVHLGCWAVTGLETWIMLRLMGTDATLTDGIIIDSLLAALRSFAFFIPNALGVQEGGYIMLCGLFGIPADIGLALSLTRRARDLAIGLPALFVWQAAEGRLLLRKRA